MFKIGEKVAVCWDGKLGRVQEGLVVAKHRNNRVLVVFDTWLDNDPAVNWFRVRKTQRKYGGSGRQVAGHYRDAECKENGWPGAWYVVHPWANIQKYLPHVAEHLNQYSM